VRQGWKVFRQRQSVVAVTFVLLLLSAFSLWGAKTHGASISITALSDVSIYDDPNPSLTTSPIFVLQKGQKRQVVGCIDIKTNIVQVVELDDGRLGYIVDGEAKMVRESYSYFRLPRFSLWNCEPFL
jgi:hypothetical protein